MQLGRRSPRRRNQATNAKDGTIAAPDTGAAFVDAAAKDRKRKAASTANAITAPQSAEGAAVPPAGKARTSRKRKSQAADATASAAETSPAAATAAAGGRNSAVTAVYAIKCSRSTYVTDYDREGQDGTDWEEPEWFNPGLREELQDQEAQAADGIWYYNTRGRPLAAIPPPPPPPKKQHKSKYGLHPTDPHYEKVGDSGMVVPKMEGPVIVFKSLEAANAKAEDVMRELLSQTERLFDREVPEDTFAKDIRDDPKAAAAAGRNKCKSSHARSEAAITGEPAPGGWQSKVTKGCIGLTATRHYLFKIWDPVDTIVCSEVSVVVEPAQCVD